MKRMMTIIAVSAFVVVGVGIAFASNVFVYPKNGQSQAQQEQAQFACYKWAKEQTGFILTYLCETRIFGRQKVAPAAARRRARLSRPSAARSGEMQEKVQ